MAIVSGTRGRRPAFTVRTLERDVGRLARVHEGGETLCNAGLRLLLLWQRCWVQQSSFPTARQLRCGAVWAAERWAPGAAGMLQAPQPAAQLRSAAARADQRALARSTLNSTARSATAMIASRSGTALHSVTASRSAQSETTDASASGASGRPLAGGCIGFGFAANADGIAEIQLVMRERKACAPSKRNFIAGKVGRGRPPRHGSSTLGGTS